MSASWAPGAPGTCVCAVWDLYIRLSAPVLRIYMSRHVPDCPRAVGTFPPQVLSPVISGVNFLT